MEEKTLRVNPGWPQDKDAFSREAAGWQWRGSPFLYCGSFLEPLMKTLDSHPEKSVCVQTCLWTSHCSPSPYWNFRGPQLDHSPKKDRTNQTLLGCWDLHWTGKGSWTLMCVRQFPQRFGSSKHVLVRTRHLCFEHSNSDAGDLQTPLKRTLHCLVLVGCGSCLSRTVKGTEQWSSSDNMFLRYEAQVWLYRGDHVEQLSTFTRLQVDA